MDTTGCGAHVENIRRDMLKLGSDKPGAVSISAWVYADTTGLRKLEDVFEALAKALSEDDCVNGMLQEFRECLSKAADGGDPGWECVEAPNVRINTTEDDEAAWTGGSGYISEISLSWIFGFNCEGLKGF